MSTTLAKEIIGVREFLGHPLSQSPSVRDIFVELEAEYQFITNQLNDKEDAWNIDEVIITSVAGQSRYRLDLVAPRFYKALNILSIPSDTVNDSPESGYELGVDLDYNQFTAADSAELLNFTSLEYLNSEWKYLKPESSQVFNLNASSSFAAIFRAILQEQGEVIYLELWPAPDTSGQKYKILYQVTDWWDKLFGPGVNVAASVYMYQKLPNSSQRMFLRALVAKNLIQKGIVKWFKNPDLNDRREAKVLKGLEDKIVRYGASFSSYKDSMNTGEVVTLASWGDLQGL